MGPDFFHTVHKDSKQVKVYTRGYISWCGMGKDDRSCDYAYSAHLASEITSVTNVGQVVTITGTGFTDDTNNVKVIVVTDGDPVCEVSLHHLL